MMLASVRRRVRAQHHLPLLGLGQPNELDRLACGDVAVDLEVQDLFRLLLHFQRELGLEVFAGNRAHLAVEVVRAVGLDVTVSREVTEVVPLDVGKSTFTPLLTSVDRMTKKMSSKNTRSVMDDMLPVRLTLLRCPRFIRVQVLRGCQ